MRYLEKLVITSGQLSGSVLQYSGEMSRITSCFIVWVSSGEMSREAGNMLVSSSELSGGAGNTYKYVSSSVFS